MNQLFDIRLKCSFVLKLKRIRMDYEYISDLIIDGLLDFFKFGTTTVFHPNLNLLLHAILGNASSFTCVPIMPLHLIVNAGR